MTRISVSFISATFVPNLKPIIRSLVKCPVPLGQRASSALMIIISHRTNLHF